MPHFHHCCLYGVGGQATTLLACFFCEYDLLPILLSWSALWVFCLLPESMHQTWAHSVLSHSCCWLSVLYQRRKQITLSCVFQSITFFQKFLQKWTCGTSFFWYCQVAVVSWLHWWQEARNQGLDVFLGWKGPRCCGRGWTAAPVRCFDVKCEPAEQSVSLCQAPAP